MKKYLSTAVLFALGMFASLPGSLAQAQDDAAMQVFRKLLMEMESQSAQRTQANANSNSVSPAILNNSRSVTLGKPSTREAPPPPPVRVTKVYDLADLFAVAPSFEAKGWVGWDSSTLLHSNSSVASASDIFGGGGGMGGMMCQTVSSTVRVPIGRASVVGGGSAIESGLENWQLSVVVSIDLVSPRERVEK